MNDLERDLLAVKEKTILLSSNGVVRRLMAAVVYNQSKETFMITESQTSVSKEIVAIENDFNKCNTLGEQRLAAALAALYCCTTYFTNVYFLFYVMQRRNVATTV
jgi:hypothetical protein